MAVKPIPDGYQTVTPYLIVEGADGLIRFLSAAFGARERMRMPIPDSEAIGHAEVTLGDSVIMLADATPEFPATRSQIHLYVEDVDKAFEAAIMAGATSQMAPEDRFYGDRAATVRDAFGNEWSLATHIEDVSEDEMMRRMAELGEG